MYLVKPGDKITFTVNADSVNKYDWQVNKEVDKEATCNSFTRTITAVLDRRTTGTVKLNANTMEQKTVCYLERD